MTSNDVGGVACDVSLFTQQGQGLVASIKGHTYHLRALGYEQSVLGFYLMAQLGFGKRMKYLNTRMVERCDVYNGHGRVASLCYCFMFDNFKQV